MNLRNGCFALLAIVALHQPLMAQAAAQQNTAALSTSSTGKAAASPDATTTVDDQWHFSFLPYLWFAGMHGTVGALGFKTGVSASPGDLLSHFNFGLMGTFEARRNRLILPTDMMWIRLSDDHGVPLNEIGITGIDFRVGQFLLTPKVGYQVLDNPRLKIHALAGMRYWHLGQKLTFKPALFNGISTSQNWVDAIGGGRITVPFTPKVSLMVAGDAGGGGASSDYQLVGLLGYQLKPNIDLQAGWRYLVVNYRDGGFLYNVTTSGVGIGATFRFK